MMRSRLMWLGLLGLVTLIAQGGCARGGKKMTTIRGEVFYLERIALPPTAVVETMLVEVIEGGAERTLAQTRFTPAQQVPIPFELEYDAAQLRPGGNYQLIANIFEGANKRFEGRLALPEGGFAEPVKLRLRRAGAPGAETH